MLTNLRGRRTRWSRQGGEPDPPVPTHGRPRDISPSDPAIAFFASSAGPVDLDRLELDSPGVQALRDAGVKLVVPLVSQGELIGLLNLGPRRSDQPYSADDRRLLDTIANQAAPTLRVAQLVRDQQDEVRRRERYEQELRVATLIQQNFLPQGPPDAPGYEVAATYRPAREVSGDFYDFIALPHGLLGIVCADVTDKGVPAALVMASTRAVLRAGAQRLHSPGEVLQRVNELVCPEMPAKMFVTCLYGVLDPSTGRFLFANAGHTLPYKRGKNGVTELRACGMPLGLMPGMRYEENECVIEPGETVLFSSDGLIEAHAPDGEMFGCQRVRQLVERHDSGLIDALLAELESFTGPNWLQEDDITLVTVRRVAGGEGGGRGAVDADRVLDEFLVESVEGNERVAMARVADAIAGLGLAAQRVEQLKTAVAEATMNAMEHGNEYRADLPTQIRVVVSRDELVVRIVDHGGSKSIPDTTSPDIDAKLAGEQSPRGWGLFLIKNMVDDMRVTSDEEHHTVELVVRLDGPATAGGRPS